MPFQFDPLAEPKQEPEEHKYTFYEPDCDICRDCKEHAEFCEECGSSCCGAPPVDFGG